MLEIRLSETDDVLIPMMLWSFSASKAEMVIKAFVVRHVCFDDQRIDEEDEAGTMRSGCGMRKKREGET